MSSIYLHIPFCRHACAYCDFYFLTNLNRQEDFFKSIEKEFLLRVKHFELQAKIETIYLGGGTPSLANSDYLGKLIHLIISTCELKEPVEITLEANPEDLDQAKIKTFKQIGINRISLGVQSFRNQDLTYLGRRQNSRQVLSVLERLTEWKNWNLDLIYGMPTLNDEAWEQNLDQALYYRPPHLSLYELTVKKKTPLDHQIKMKRKKPTEENRVVQQYLQGINKLESVNYQHYEISNFCIDRYSQHNLNCWQGKPYIGLGPSAHSYNGRMRSQNHAHLTRYLKSIAEEKIPVEWAETISTYDQLNEYLMTNLRTCWGISLKEIQQRFGKEVKEKLLKKIEPLLTDHQMVQIEDHLSLTTKGKLFCDQITSQLFQLKS